MITTIVICAWAIVGGGIWAFERKKRKKEKQAQEFQDKWLNRNQKEKQNG